MIGDILSAACAARARSVAGRAPGPGARARHRTGAAPHDASGAATAHLWVLDGQQGMLHAIGRDAALMERIQNGWEGFQRYLDQDIPPPLSEADTRQRSDDAWRQAARAALPSPSRGRTRPQPRWKPPEPSRSPWPSIPGNRGRADRHAVLKTGRRGLQTHSRTQDRGSDLFRRRASEESASRLRACKSSYIRRYIAWKKKTPLSHR